MTTLHALFVGIDQYREASIPDLRFARSDAETLDDAFRRCDYRDDIRTHLLVDVEATRSNILDLAGRQLPTSIGEDDLAVFYFAGHGSPELVPGLDDASRYLVCHDSSRDQLMASAIDVAVDLPRIAARCRCRMLLFLLDACFSGYSGGRGIVGLRLASARRAGRPGVRLRDLPLGEGLAFIAAATDDQVAWEEPALAHGVFSYHLLSALLAAGQGEVIGVASLYNTLFTRVRAHTDGRQTPVLWGRVTGAGLPRLRRGQPTS